MSIKVPITVIPVDVKQYINEYTEKLKHCFVEQILIDESACIHKKWPTTVCSFNYGLAEGFIPYPN